MKVIHQKKLIIIYEVCKADKMLVLSWMDFKRTGFLLHKEGDE